MAPSSLLIDRLEEAMRKTGCPICRLEHETAIRSIDSFLWEYTNDPGARKPINEAYGFCSAHTRMLVAIELSSSGSVLGVNIIYALLAKNVSQELKNLSHRETTKRKVQSITRMLKLSTDHPITPSVLEPKGICPVCDQAEQSGMNSLSTLFEEFSTQDTRIREVYKQSNGLCLHHLQVGLHHFMAGHPAAADFLILDTVHRLDLQQVQMQEFIRKHNWAYREEELKPEERVAWLRTLTFFTGDPSEKFNHRVDNF